MITMKKLSRSEIRRLIKLALPPYGGDCSQAEHSMQLSPDTDHYEDYIQRYQLNYAPAVMHTGRNI